MFSNIPQKQFHCKNNDNFSLAIADFGADVSDLYDFGFRGDNENVWLLRTTNFSEINHLIIEHGIIKFLLDGISEIFSGLGKISIVNCGLLILKKQNLKQFGKKLVQADFSYNFLTFLDDRNLFNYNPNLKKIDFSGNFLQFIDVNLFNSFEGNLEINFSNNLCINSNETWRGIESNLTSKTQDFHIIGCNETDTIVDYQAIKSTLGRVNKALITCDISMETTFSSRSLSYENSSFFVCDDLVAENPKVEITSAYLKSEYKSQNQFRNKNVYLKFIDLKLEYLPRRITNVFIDVVSLQITNCGLHYITKLDLKPFGNNLIHCQLNRNSLEVIRKDLFKFNENLKDINLSDNPIKYIDEKFFQSLKNIRHLELIRMTRCNCISISIDHIKENFTAFKLVFIF